MAMLCDMDWQEMGWISASSSLSGDFGYVKHQKFDPALMAFGPVLGIRAIVVQTRCKREVFMGVSDACTEDNLFLQHSLYFIAATAVNVVATTLICARLLHMKFHLLRLDQSTERFGRGAAYNRITMILIESALPSTAVGLSCAVLSVVRRTGYWYFARRLWTPAIVCFKFSFQVEC